MNTKFTKFILEKKLDSKSDSDTEIVSNLKTIIFDTLEKIISEKINAHKKL